MRVDLDPDTQQLSFRWSTKYGPERPVRTLLVFGGVSTRATRESLHAIGGNVTSLCSKQHHSGPL